jgi:hypothetical protein
MHWFIPVLIGGGLALLVLIASSRLLAAPGMVLLVALALIVPTAYSATTWYAPVEGTFPAAGPKFNAGTSTGFGVSTRTLGVYHALAAYAMEHRPGSRYLLLVVASDTAAPMIIQGYAVAAVGGYSGNDPSIDGRGLARLVRERLARYVVLGGAYSTRGGNGATQAALAACPVLPLSTWHSPSPYPGGLSLLDCAGRERALERAAVLIAEHGVQPPGSLIPRASSARANR